MLFFQSLYSRLPASSCSSSISTNISPNVFLNSFDYNVIDQNGHDKDKLDNSPEFKNTLGDILVEILDEQLEAGNLEYND